MRQWVGSCLKGTPLRFSASYSVPCCKCTFMKKGWTMKHGQVWTHSRSSRTPPPSAPCGPPSSTAAGRSGRSEPRWPAAAHVAPRSRCRSCPEMPGTRCATHVSNTNCMLALKHMSIKCCSKAHVLYDNTFSRVCIWTHFLHIFVGLFFNLISSVLLLSCMFWHPNFSSGINKVLSHRIVCNLFRWEICWNS